MGDQTACKYCGHYPAVCEDTISELNEKLAAANEMVEKIKECLAALMIRHALATGHGDTVEDLFSELDAQLIERERRAEENARDAERYRWATENVLRFSPELRPERKPISCPDKLAGCMVAHFAPIKKSDIDKVIDAARNEEREHD